ncbi:EamA family transporter [Chitinophaga sp. SYP-B3965]|uniref:EamA family transporter n=1 Tax=Chitinophaga sp. SYP-B3965 TaxID=2663120 RepID=UPI001299CAF5|nr:DMT family transporter [Chitinophaga sp. SYP-B3965]MRG44986.1 EamA family transporter [Chitinophaga sp. SYP-B3965]
MTRYIFMVFAGACSFGILSTFVKLAYREGYSAAEISLSQAFMGLIVLGLLQFLFSREKGFKGGLPVLFTGVTIGLTTFFYYVSVVYIPASLSIVLLMQCTWMGILLDWVLFKKQPGWVQGFVTLLILAGTIMASGIITNPALEISLKGVLYALASAFCYAGFIVANSRTGQQMATLKKSTIIMLGSTLSIFIVNAHQLVVSNHFDAGILKWALFLSLFGTIIPPVLFAKGIPKVGAGISAIVMTAELPVAVICSHIVLQEPVGWVQWVGVFVMLLAIGLLQFLRRNFEKGKSE